MGALRALELARLGMVGVGEISMGPGWQKTHEQDLDVLLTMPVIAGQAVVLAPSNDERNTVLYFSRKGTSLSVLQPPMRMPPLSAMAPTDPPSALPEP